MDDAEKARVYRDVKAAVKMAPAAIEKWLDTDDSRRVGWKGSNGDGPAESIGHKSAAISSRSSASERPISRQPIMLI